ncbi:MAG: hypothetical protein JRG71_05915 [Deltaproteobacteria bacterium]|nr:hypothetical protein [Deltaproteobacteria bacterium]
MNHITIPAQLESSLKCSIEQYQGILAHLQLLSNSLTASDNDFQQHVNDLASKQAQAREHDEILVGLLRGSAPLVKDHPLYQKRKDLIKEVLELNHLLLPKINGMMALVSHELADLKNGRIVLGGYKQNTHKQGRLVKSSA